MELTIPNVDENTKVKLFYYLIGESGRELLRHSYDCTAARRKESSMMALFDKTLQSELIRLQRGTFCLFFLRNQGLDENIDKYVMDLRVLAGTNFGDIKDSLIRDRMVYGTNNSAMRERLLRDEKLTLVKCLQI